MTSLFVFLFFSLFSARPLLLGAQNRNIARLEVAKTDEQLAKGLSHREGMNSNDGMLFELPSDSESCFWMKDMRFPLDIIWLNTSKQVTHIASNIKPETYPKSFCGPIDTPYVIELTAGAAARNNISVGTALNW